MQVEVLTLVLLCTQVLCGQPVPIAVDLNNEMKQYQRLAEYAVKVSMNLSILVTGMTKELFIRSDEIEKQAALLEEAVITKAQAISTNINTVDCVQKIMISRSVKEMQAYIRQTTKCLLREADINTLLETTVTSLLNHQRSHVFEGRRAMEMCSLDPDPAFRAHCLDAISNELNQLEIQTRADMKKIQRRSIQRKKYLPDKMRICESLSRKFVKAVRENIDKIGCCEELAAK